MPAEKTIPTLFRSLASRGLSLSLTTDGALSLSGPKENRLPAHREFIQANKEDLRDALYQQQYDRALVIDAIEAATEGRMPLFSAPAQLDDSTFTDPAEFLLSRLHQLRSAQGGCREQIAGTVLTIAQWWDGWQIGQFLESGNGKGWGGWGGDFE